MSRRSDPWRPVDDDARRLARTLLRSARFGALGVIDRTNGAPAVSRVNVATNMSGTPGFLISHLSPHFGALEADSRCSLLLGEPGKGDPLAHPRITLIGHAHRMADGAGRAALRRRFLWRHPKSALYVDFGDMAFWQFYPERALLNGGYGKAYALSPTDMATETDGIEELEAVEEGAVEHMNRDHADTIDRYASLIDRTGKGWRLISLDPEGLDLMRGEETARLWFDQPLQAAGELRPRLVALAHP